MSSEPTPTHPTPHSAPPAPHAPAHPVAPRPDSSTGTRASDKIAVYRHSNFFYWWPVWALGFVFAIITYFDNKHLAIVPDDTVAAENREVVVDDKGTKETRDVLILDKGKTHVKRKDEEGTRVIVQPTIYITHYKELGSIYAGVLLLVITITSISLRGLWTVLMMVALIMLIFIFSAAGIWGSIFHRLNQLSIYINMGGYILISAVLFILWVINFVFLDRQTYMVFTPGQVRVRLEIGGEETVYDTSGMVVQRERGDLIRHWILGFGSGDLIIKPVGVTHPLVFPNVLRVGKIASAVETMVKEKVIVKSTGDRGPSA